MDVSQEGNDLAHPNDKADATFESLSLPSNKPPKAFSEVEAAQDLRKTPESAKVRSGKADDEGNRDDEDTGVRWT